MASGSFLVLLDDIAAMLDDIATMAKVATKKTAGVLGDDLAVNAEQVSGFAASRELPVVWAVLKGSLVNKVILVPTALAISYFMPWLLIPLLMLGGAFLCFEGFEKMFEKYLHPEEPVKRREERHQALANPEINLLDLEKTKIKGAIRTDFILSAEIVAIALSTVSDKAFSTQLFVLTLVAFIVTFAVYGLVGAIVKMDDVGMWLNKKQSSFAKMVGMGLIRVTPYMMKLLAILGTIAMFLVGGGLVVHNWSWLHHVIESATSGLPLMLSTTAPHIATMIVGFLIGGLVTAGVVLIHKFKH